MITEERYTALKNLPRIEVLLKTKLPCAKSRITSVFQRTEGLVVSARPGLITLLRQAMENSDSPLTLVLSSMDNMQTARLSELQITVKFFNGPELPIVREKVHLWIRWKFETEFLSQDKISRNINCNTMLFLKPLYLTCQASLYSVRFPRGLRHPLPSNFT